MAFLAGIRLVSFDDDHASVSLPFSYLNRNPFRSIYFACQSMAAEFSTAVLCLREIARHNTEISLLVVHIEADFVKKADEMITFSCYKTGRLRQAIQRCVTREVPQKATLATIGCNSSGETVAEFTITWSFKARP